MTLLENSKYCPADERVPVFNLSHIAHEILRCECGRLLTWFDMIVKED